MMTLSEKIKNLSGDLREKCSRIKTLEATKNAIVMPLLSAMGYDVFDPDEVIPQYIVGDLAHKRETVDYAVLKDGKPVILIECKHWEANLDKEKTQLKRFMSFTGARIGVYTNGLEYRFYGDLEKPGVMDAAPFLEFDLIEAPEAKVAALENFTKQRLEVEKIAGIALQLKVRHDKSVADKDRRDRHGVTKKEFLVHLREDVSTSVIWSLIEHYRGVSVASGYDTLSRLELALFAKKCSLLIVDECHFDGFDELMEFVDKIKYSNVTFKVLAVMCSWTAREDIDRLLKMGDVVVDVIIRPFTIKRLYAYLEKAFGMKKAVVKGIKYVTNESLRSGLVAAENIYVPGSDELIVECGVVLEDRHIMELIRYNIDKVKVHEDAFKFINCWEYRKCQHPEVCPTFINVDADGFLDGANAGRACMYINATTELCGSGGSFNSWEEKIKQICRNCEFYGMVLDSNEGVLPKSSVLKEHIDRNARRRKLMEKGQKAKER
jgi:hypothetical protein